VLAKLNSSWSPSGQSADRELLTEEENVIFRKIGLKMDERVLLGIAIHLFFYASVMVSRTYSRRRRARDVRHDAERAECTISGG
jgi:hypothetical protein